MRPGIVSRHRDEVWCVDISWDGRWLASGSRDETIRIWSTARPEEAPTSWSLSTATREVYLAPDGATLATISTNEVLQIRRGADFECLAEMTVPFRHRKNWSNNQWTQVALSPGGTHLAMGSGIESGMENEEPGLSTFEIPSMREVARLHGLRTWVTGLTFFPDGTKLAATGFFSERLCDLTGQLTYFTAVAWSPNGARLIGGGADGTVTIWDTASRQQVGRLKGHRQPIRGLAFLPDGDRLISVSMDSLRLWQAPRLAEVAAAD